MGSTFSHQELIDDLGSIIGSIQKRLSRLETDNAATTKLITNLNVSNKETELKVSRIHEHLFKCKILEEGGMYKSRSVRKPKGSVSLYTK